MFGMKYQYFLILLGVIATALFSVFFYRELNPEYMIYQKAYVDLENFRSSYTKEPPPAFSYGIKQIVIEKEDKGPAEIDRCTSCHVALQIPDFSPTKISYDINGNMNLDKDGFPVKIPNENYVWTRLDEQIQKLKNEGKETEAQKLASLKQANVGSQTYDMTKVLQMHPLMGRETRPFEYHPLEEYGCVSCHGGNGRGLVTDRAHGPVFDGTYEVESHGFVPQFLERDEKNDPKFARVFNHKPGARLLFQTNPIYVGALIEANCVQCHLTSSEKISNAVIEVNDVLTARENELKEASLSFEQDKAALLSLIALRNDIEKKGYEAVLKEKEQASQDYALSLDESRANTSQYDFLKNHPEEALKTINSRIFDLIGEDHVKNADDIDSFLRENRKSSGALFEKYNQMQLQKDMIAHIREVKTFSSRPLESDRIANHMETDVDRLMANHKRGENLFISQACYACHRIAGTARGGVGPELTKEGDSYPWFIKESIVWPQADLKNSTMPNPHLDHEELEDLVTYLLAQKGERKAFSGSAYKTKIADWEAGKKTWFEERVPPSKIHDLNYAMTVFAVEGCASCHRLKGFESEVGYSKENSRSSEWFQNLFPEDIAGSQIAKRITENSEEIDKNIKHGVRENALIETIEKAHPHTIEAFYPEFKFASRARNHELTGEALERYQDRVHRVLMMFIQEYGLGKLIGPRPNWSGIFRTDEWLIEHFKAPTSHVPRSIMPVMPFDDTKFYALTNMLNVLGRQNRDQLKELWSKDGFKPDKVYETLCSQCHGDYLQGNGPVSEWIYPIPKNLRKVDFMRNLTRTRVRDSIKHGIKGTPMPPWGEAAEKPGSDGIAVLSEKEIEEFTDWLYSFLPGGELFQNQHVPKWDYKPSDVIEELKREGNTLQKKDELSLLSLEKFYGFTAALAPAQTKEDESNKIFDAIPNRINGVDEYMYFIKKDYYTQENIEAGKAFFWENCAVCHGKEADGAGIRAEAMFEAKPRMLTNLDWINSKDDIRLLSSIKYGVPGTAMTPWGDLTSSKQRLQLVIFIRNLTQQAEARAKLLSDIFKTFDSADILLETARVEEYKKLEEIKEALSGVKETIRFLDLSQATDKQKNEALELFGKELDLKIQYAEQLKVDDRYKDIKNSLKREKEEFLTIGTTLLGLDDPDKVFGYFLEIISLMRGKMSLENERLQFSWEKKSEEKINESVKNILELIDARILQKKSQKATEEGKITSPMKKERIMNLTAEISNLERVKKILISGIEQAARERDTQKKIINELNS